MASFRKRASNRWQAQVRRKGYPPQSKTFVTRAAAVQWVRSIEYEMDQGLFVSRDEAETTTVAELLNRYLPENYNLSLCQKGGSLRYLSRRTFFQEVTSNMANPLSHSADCGPLRTLKILAKTILLSLPRLSFRR